MPCQPWGRFHAARGEKNDSNVPLGSGNYLNGIPPSAAREGPWGGSRTVPSAPPWLLDGTGEGLHATACFPRASCCQSDHRKPAHRRSNGYLTSRGARGVRWLGNVSRTETSCELQTGSACPGLCCPVQKAGSCLAGSQSPAVSRLPWALRDAAVGCLAPPGAGWGGQALPSDNRHTGQGQGRWL